MSAARSTVPVLRPWRVSVLTPGMCWCWDGFADDPMQAAALAFAHWAAAALVREARAEVREVGARRARPVYVGWL